jgi:hypothetical protein
MLMRVTDPWIATPKLTDDQVERSEQDPTEDAVEDHESDGPAEGDLTDELVGFGEPPLSGVTRGDREEPHGQPPAGSDRADPRGDPSGECDGDLPDVPPRDLLGGQPGTRIGRRGRQAAPTQARSESECEQHTAPDHDRHVRSVPFRQIASTATIDRWPPVGVTAVLSRRAHDSVLARAAVRWLSRWSQVLSMIVGFENR